MSATLSGIVYRQRNGSMSQLPLEEVKVDALVVDVSARVTVRQEFVNPSMTSTSRAKYIFPLPAHAAVCAFEMHTTGGRRIVGEAKDKSEAEREHKEALKQGITTGLVERVAGDIFTISLGSIPGEETVTTVITYAMVLLDDDSVERIRLQIPMWVGERYGQAPEGLADAFTPSKHTRVRFNVLVQTRGIVQQEDISSPSHPQISVQPYPTHQGRPSRHRLSVKFRSTRFLEKDFVLQITAKGLDESRCFLERDNRRGTVAMQLTLLPKFQLPSVEAQEYLFLVDRSGSMSGARIETARKALLLLLRALPSQGTSFNVFYFDHEWNGLWSTSEEYNQNSLDQATNFVASIWTNGGTELGGALQHTLRTRDPTRPTVLFVLTDGEVHAVDTLVNLVGMEVARASPSAPLRVFTLGIGSTASSAACQGIADAGNGQCLMTTTAEGIIGKCSKLLRAGRGFLLKNVTVDWGVPLEPVVPDANDLSSVRFAVADPLVRQAPSHVDNIYPGFRLVVYAIIKSDRINPPSQITVRAQRDGAGDVLEFSIPVERVRFSDENVQNGLIHTLAARGLIKELEDPMAGQSLAEHERIQSIVDLGTRYQLASRYTSFVAVDGVEPESLLPRALRRTKSSRFSRDPAAVWDLPNTVNFAMDVVATFLEMCFSPPPSVWGTHDTMPGGDDPLQSRPSSFVYRDGPDDDDGDDGENGGETDGTFTTMSSLESDTSSAWSVSRPPTPPPEDVEFVRSPSPDFQTNQDPDDANAAVDAADVAPPVPSDGVMKLAQQMSYDGSFAHDAIDFLGETAVQEGRRLNVDDNLWATILAIAYFQKYLGGQRDLMDSLVEKALDYVYEQHGQDRGKTIPWLLNHAAPLV